MALSRSRLLGKNTMNTTDNDITRGTDNVFADLNLPDAAECQTKTRLALAVNNLLKARQLRQRSRVNANNKF